ncbi:MAG: hypothetical protein JSV88_14220, partial [Candidatus Aminicenantes bacterium]
MGLFSNLADAYRWRAVKRHAKKVHEQALEVVRAHYNHGEPFALFLRDFDWDFVRLYSGSDLDARIRSAIERHMPIIGVCDARDPLQFWLQEAKDRIPVLILEDETWEESVTHLVKNAAVLVVHCLYLSPGVERELEIISKFQRQDSTIIVLPPPDEDPLAGIPVTQTGPDGTIMSRNFTKATPGDRRFRQYAA